jgi:G2/mitotic-specific cyclin-B, other
MVVVQTGVAALVIANKYEEVYGPTLRDYETICAGAYTRADILRMERAILKILDFDITVPTTFTFLTRYLKVSAYSRHAEFGHLAQYLCEWALLSNTCLQWSASLIAASAIYACFKAFSLNGMHLLGAHAWLACLLCLNGPQLLMG